MNALAPYWKAIVGFLAPAAVTLTAAVQESSAGGVAVTQGEWITAACAAVITAGSVYAATNTPPGPITPADGADRVPGPDHSL